ncbi:MAG: PQQ-like beta-propeller repeat protein, partial [Candidatus Zixiibacteriota bacterium]
MSGDLIWSHPIGIFYDGHLIDSSPAIGDDGTIYFGADQYGAAGQAPVPIDTAFYAVNPDGTLKWKLAVGDGVESSPAIGHDGTIYVGSYDSCVYAIEDAGTEGVFKWKFTTGGPVDASPTVDGDGTIYIGSNDSLMYALHPDGSVKWSFATGGAIESSVAIDDNGYMYFGSFDGKLYALGSGAPDVGAVAVDIPALLKTESTHDPTATFRNYRGSTASFDAFCHITDGSGLVYADTVNIVDLPAAGIRTVSFSPWTVGADTGITYTIIAVADLTEDDNTANDTIEAMAKSVAELPYICGDLNGDEQVDISDVTLLIDYLFI